MTGPEAAETHVAAAPLRRLNKRSQFLRAARGNRAGRRAFALQVVASGEPTPGIGFTVTKKIGNAPERNRIKRRLRALAAASARDFRAGHDYVLLGRREALGESFAVMLADLNALVGKVHAEKSSLNQAAGGLRKSRQ
jgi:ribonuclease P protein component